MNARDLIRGMLDLLDQHEEHDKEEYGDEEESCGHSAKIDIHQNDETDSRFKHILAMLDPDSFSKVANAPNEVIAPVSAVTTDAGGGLNGPKHPADIRVKDPGYGHGG